MIGNEILHFIKYELGLDKPHSQTTIAEQEAIAQYSKKAFTAIEIGVYEGVNTIILAKNIDRKGKLYAIDPFFKGKIGICYYKIIIKHEIRKNHFTEKIVLIPKLSFDAIEDVPNDIDFIFIDGDHSEEGIRKDWKLFSEKVKIGGIIALHDTSIPKYDKSEAQLGSFKYFNSFIKYDDRFDIIETVDSLNILKRK